MLRRTVRDYVSKLRATVENADEQLRTVETFVNWSYFGAAVHKVVITQRDLSAAEMEQLLGISSYPMPKSA